MLLLVEAAFPAFRAAAAANTQAESPRILASNPLSPLCQCLEYYMT